MINNKKKLIALALCSSTLLVGCNKNLQEISLETANEFCLKNYKSIIKVCSKADVNYNISLSYEKDVDPEAATVVSEFSDLIQWASLYKDDTEFIGKIVVDKDNEKVTIKFHDVHINSGSSEITEEQVMFFVPSLGLKVQDEEISTAYIKPYFDDHFSNESKIYVSSNNSIVLKGSLMVKNGKNKFEGPCLFPNVEERFDSDGCSSSLTMKLNKGIVISDAQGEKLCTVSEDSSMTATYTYF